MGNNIPSRQNGSLCEYEKMRMEILQSNVAKMKAKGYGTLENKILQEKYDAIAKGVTDEVIGEDMDFQFEPELVSNVRMVDSEVNHFQPTKVSKNENSSRAKKAKQPLTQTLPMAEFLASKT